MRHQYELMQMENNEKIVDFFNRIITHTNSMKNYGKKISNQTIVEKILRTLNPKFDHIVIAIEESKKLKEIAVEEFQGSLEAHEQRLIEREIEKPGDHQALQAHTSKRVGNNSEGNFRGRGRGKNFKSSFKRNTQNQEQEKNEEDQPESSNRKRNFNNWREKKKKIVDRKRIKCFNYNQIGYFSTVCGHAK